MGTAGSEVLQPGAHAPLRAVGDEQLVGDEEGVVAIEGEALQQVVVDVVAQHLLLPPMDLLTTLQG